VNVESVSFSDKLLQGFRKSRARLAFVLLAISLYRSNRKAISSSEIIVLPHMGYGDQITCLPIYKYLAENGKKITVIAQEAHITFLSQVLSSDKISFIPIERAFKATLSLNIPISKQALTFSKAQRQHLLVLGYELLVVRSHLSPEVDFNALFYEFAKVPIASRDSLQLNAKLAQIGSKYPVPDVPYALVDHFPGTIREIPSSVLQDIEQRGFKIVFNPRQVPYMELSELIEGAAELHCVNSSFFCLSLLLELKANSKNVYLMREGLYHNLGFYDESWQEWILNDQNLHPLPIPYRFDSSVHTSLMKRKASQFWRVQLNRLLFGGSVR
jgi:hypothetical protein